jgi:hypothetical protein
MESIGILRVLWRRRIAVGLGALLALLIGVLTSSAVSLSPPGLQSRTTVSGFAQEHVLVNTPTSLLADARAKGAASIETRAVLLSDLLASNEARTRMARGAGLRPAEIGVVGLGTAAPDVVTPLAEQAIQATQPHTPYLVTVSEGPSLPILSVLATAPEEKAAARLAGAATATLASLAREAPTAGGDLKVERLGEEQTGSKVVGARKSKAAIAALLVFILWCTAVVVLDGFLRRRRSPSPRTAGQGARA